VAAVAARFGLSPQAPAFCALAAAGVPLAFFDARTSRLPNVVTLPAYPVSLALLGAAALSLAGGAERFVHALIGMAVAVAFFGLLLLVSPAGIGMGDVKLAGPLGAYLGWLGATAFAAGLVAAWLLAAVTGLGLMLAHRADRKTQIPFGPFLIAATLAVVLAIGAAGQGDQSSAPTSTGSADRSTPNALRTPSVTSRASASRLAVVAPPGLTRARVCLAEIRAPFPSAPGRYPLAKPARSMSQAAGTLTCSGPAWNVGTRTPGPRLTATVRSSSANAAWSRTGLVKKEPALRVSGSVGSSTMPLLRRSASTADLTSPSGARPPSATPSARASSA
jgi:leader peptidase (prepilin peptidase)/N-methyltransferase